MAWSNIVLFFCKYQNSGSKKERTIKVEEIEIFIDKSKKGYKYKDKVNCNDSEEQFLTRDLVEEYVTFFEQPLHEASSSLVPNVS